MNAPDRRCARAASVVKYKYCRAAKSELKKGEKTMKKEKIRFIFFFLASICFLIVSVINFMDKDIATAIIFLLLGVSFLLLSTAHLKKGK